MMAAVHKSGRDMSAVLFGRRDGSDDADIQPASGRARNANPYQALGGGDLPQAPDWLVNMGAGFGDSVTLDGTKVLRDLLGIQGGIDGGIQTCSPGYLGGDALGALAGGGRMGYATLAKRGAARAESGAAASAYRDMLKKKFRLGIAPNWRTPNLKDKTDAQLRASAGRTNTGMNLYGAALTGIGLGNIADCIPALTQSLDEDTGVVPILKQRYPQKE